MDIANWLHEKRLCGPPQDVRLLFNGRQLAPLTTFAENGISKGDVVEVRHLVKGGSPNAEGTGTETNHGPDKDGKAASRPAGSSSDMPPDFPSLPQPGPATGRAAVSSILPQPGPPQRARAPRLATAGQHFDGCRRAHTGSKAGAEAGYTLHRGTPPSTELAGKYR